MNTKTNQTEFIAKKITDLRNSVNWSQAELARKANVTSATISLVEKGDRMPSLTIIRKLAEALNVSVAEFIGDSTIDSSVDLEAQIFFRKFRDLNKLNDADQELIQTIIQRLKEGKKKQR